MTATIARNNSWIYYAGISLLIGGVVYYLANRGYAEVSETGYEFGLALMSACNRQDFEQIRKIDQQFEQLVAANKMPEYDEKVLRDIIDSANSGEWNVANRHIRSLMNAQIDSSLAITKSSD